MAKKRSIISFERDLFESILELVKNGYPACLIRLILLSAKVEVGADAGV
jgi:hypothetical protein